MFAWLDAFSVSRNSKGPLTQSSSRLVGLGLAGRQYHLSASTIEKIFHSNATRFQNQQVGALFVSIQFWSLLGPMFCHLRNGHPLPISSRLTVKRIFLTEANTGLLSGGSGHAELGSCWKASHVKMMIWWFCQRAMEFSNLTGVLWWTTNLCVFVKR